MSSPVTERQGIDSSGGGGGAASPNPATAGASGGVGRGGAQGRESRQRQELEKDKGRFGGWEDRMGLLAGPSFVDESERRWGAGGGQPQGRTRGLLERLVAGCCCCCC